jgi:hypothetical protein
MKNAPKGGRNWGLLLLLGIVAGMWYAALTGAFVKGPTA